MTSSGRDPELLQAGPPAATPATRRHRLVLLACVVVVLAALGLATRLPSGPDRSSPEPGPTPTTSAGPTPTSTASTVSRRPTVVRQQGPGIPGLSHGDLYARGADLVYRIELGSGRVTATPATVGSSSPAALIAGPSGVLLRPLDPGPGLLVPDGGPARPLRGRLGAAAQVLPGPGSQLWVSRSFDGRSSIFTLTSFSGRPTGTSVRESGYFLSDGDGGLLLVDTGGVWERRGSRWRRISDGTVLASGRGHHLLSSCDDLHRCGVERYDRRTGRRTPVLPGPSLDLTGGGLLSPDGRFVAATSFEAGAAVTRVVELDTGRVLAELDPGSAPDSGQLLWTPDGQHLLGLDQGRLVVLDVTTGRLRRPDLPLPDLMGLALRP